MKIKIIISLSIVITMFFIGCNKQISISTKNGEFTGTYENGNAEEFKKEPNINELKFFEDINKAVLSNNFDEDLSAKNVKKIIKILEKDDDCIVFFATEKDYNDVFFIYKMKEKNEDNKKYYSRPILATGWQWKDKRNYMKRIEKEGGEADIEKIRCDLMMFNGNNAFTLGKDKENIKWGLSIDENINNLKINGIPPTEIIKTKLDDDDVYFWYYEGLDLDHSNISKVKITF